MPFILAQIVPWNKGPSVGLSKVIRALDRAERSFINKPFYDTSNNAVELTDC